MTPAKADSDKWLLHLPPASPRSLWGCLGLAQGSCHLPWVQYWAEDCHFLPQHQLNFVAIPYWSCRLDPGYSTKNYGRSRYPFATERLASLRILPAPSQRFLNRKGGHPVCNKQPPCDPLVLLDCNNKPKSASSRDGNSHAGSTSQNIGALVGSPAPVHRFAKANLPRILCLDKAWKSDQNDLWALAPLANKGCLLGLLAECH